MMSSLNTYCLPGIIIVSALQAWKNLIQQPNNEGTVIILLESVGGLSIGQRGQGCRGLKGYTKESRGCPVGVSLKLQGESPVR